MKYLNLILTLIAAVLVLAAFRVSQIGTTLGEILESNQQLIDSQKAVIASSAHLENTILGLKEEINKVSDKFGNMASSSVDLERTISGLKEEIGKVTSRMRK